MGMSICALLCRAIKLGGKDARSGCRESCGYERMENRVVTKWLFLLAVCASFGAIAGLATDSPLIWLFFVAWLCSFFWAGVLCASTRRLYICVLVMGAMLFVTSISASIATFPESNCGVIPCALPITLVLVLLGYSLGYVPRVTPDNICTKCGYDLTGNVSGRCPECGVRVRR